MGRYFVAIDLPTYQKEEIAGLLDKLAKPRYNGARWVKAQNYHLTLLFLGDIAPADLAEFSRRCRRIASATLPFTFVLEQWNCFPSLSRPRVLFIEASRGRSQLTALAAQLAQAAAPWLSGGSPRFHPHVTVARFPRPVVGQRLPGFVPLTVSVDGFWLFSSQLTPTGPVYTKVDRFCCPGIVRGE